MKSINTLLFITGVIGLIAMLKPNPAAAAPAADASGPSSAGMPATIVNVPANVPVNNLPPTTFNVQADLIPAYNLDNNGGW